MTTRRLDAVLRVRELREQLARGDVARQRAVLHAREDAEASARAAIQVADRSHAVAAPLFLARRAMLAGGAAEVRTAGLATHAARHELDEAAAHWRRTAQRLDGIERLVERLTAEAEIDARRADANELDDLVLMRRHRRDDSEPAA